MVKLNGIRERWLFQAYFDRDGNLDYIDAVGKSTEPVQRWTAFPPGFYVVVERASENAEHLVRAEHYQRFAPRLDGAGFIVGVCVRDLG